jgi:hypothetical protein
MMPATKPQEPRVDTQQILDALNVTGRLPAEALRSASLARQSLVPIFLEAFDDYAASGKSRIGDDALFFAFHLLGEWREKSAYRPLARVLRLPPDPLRAILDGAVPETIHRVMINLFDGDPAPLQEIVRDSNADEFVRSRMIQAIALLARRGEIPRQSAAQFLSDCYGELQPRENCFVWCGWQDAIAWLGLAELRPLVQQAFARGSIHPGWLSLKDFEMDLQHTLDHPDADPLHQDGNLAPFGDTVDELSSWHCFQPKPAAQPKRPQQPSRYVPELNPHRKVGRNDPCPCGSGKKFKKCCLSAEAAAALT